MIGASSTIVARMACDGTEPAASKQRNLSPGKMEAPPASSIKGESVDSPPTSPVRRMSTKLGRLLGGGSLLGSLDEFQKRRAQQAEKLADTGCVKDNIYHWDPKSLRIRAINWSHVWRAIYLPYVYKVSIIVMLSCIAGQAWSGAFNLARVAVLAGDPVLVELVIACALVVAYVQRTKQAVYCLETALFVPPQEWQVTRAELMMMMKAQDCFDEASLEFLSRVLATSGTGESTAWPPSISASRDGKTPALTDIVPAREEAKAVIFPMVRELLKKTGIPPKDVDFLVINCSLFSPTPSLCALVCNEFCMREDVRTYNLGGMGCSANVIAVDLAKQLLQNSPGSRALVISTENLTQNLYKGNEKAWLLQNTLFRCGGCALMLSSRSEDSSRAKYKLLHTFRAQVSDDKSYNAVMQTTDSEGNVGVALSKEIVQVAGRAMKRNFLQLGPHVLPLREQLKVLVNTCAQGSLPFLKKMGIPYFKEATVPSYMPNFARGIEHFCIHAGGRAVIEGVQRSLNLTAEQVAPSMQTLEEFGNTSSSSIWYEAEWVERHGNLKRGDRMLQIAFGSGFKCNSAVWIALNVDHAKRGVCLKSRITKNVGDSA